MGSRSIGSLSFVELVNESIATLYAGNAAAFARAAGLKSSSIVVRWRQGCLPQARTLQQIAPALHVDPKELIDLVYGGGPAARTDLGRPHPLAAELHTLLAPGGGLARDERQALITVVDAVLQPYRAAR